ncbi:MAG: hypothetical protein ACXVLT_07245, partial [Flavisolibacter sp.]
IQGNQPYYRWLLRPYTSGIADDELFDNSTRLVQDADAFDFGRKRINCWFLLKRGAGHALLSPRRRS